MPGRVRAGAQHAFLAGIDELVPDLLPAARELLDRVSGPNWTLEWNLAEWLGVAYGLPEAMRRRLLLSNIYLIAFARLTDDLADDEACHPESDIVLATSVHHLWLREYLGIFSDAATLRRFWGHVDAGLAAWMRATVTPVPDLSDRGAFLRIGAAASCVAAGREDVLPVVTDALDGLLVGIVMLDDFFDWPRDLPALRNNSFVNHCAGADGPLRPDGVAVYRHAITRAVCVEGAGSSFFGKLHQRLAEAEQASHAADCTGLTAFIRWYDEEVEACARWLAGRISAQALAFLADSANQGDRAEAVYVPVAPTS